MHIACRSERDLDAAWESILWRRLLSVKSSSTGLTISALREVVSGKSKARGDNMVIELPLAVLSSDGTLFDHVDLLAFPQFAVDGVFPFTPIRRLFAV